MLLDGLAQHVFMPWISLVGDFLEPRPYTGQTLVIFLTAKHVRVPIWTFLQQASRESGSRRLATGLGELLTEDKTPRVSDERLLNQRWLEGSPATEGPLGASCITLHPHSPTAHTDEIPFYFSFLGTERRG